MRFTKVQGIANDYVLIDALAEPSILEHPDLAGLARAMSDRHRGVGSDGILIASASAHAGPAHLTLRIINSDGSEGGICGNGARCAVKYAVERGLAEPGPDGAMLLEMGGRQLRARAQIDSAGRVSLVTIDMGVPELEPSRVPVLTGRLERVESAAGAVAEFRVMGWPMVFVSMGNPHAVAFVDEPVDKIDLAVTGPTVEHHPAFPARMNLQVVNVVSRREVRVRTWERGAGITLGCGSGACAVVAAGAASGRLERSARVRMSGGDLHIEWEAGTGRVLMSGDASLVFEGEWSLAGAALEPRGWRA